MTAAVGAFGMTAAVRANAMTAAVRACGRPLLLRLSIHGEALKDSICLSGHT